MASRKGRGKRETGSGTGVLGNGRARGMREAAEPASLLPSPASRASASLTRAQKLDLYYWMRLTRSLEERLVALYRQTKVVGGLFRSLGQEADAVGSAYALERRDILSPLIRNLGSMLVKGATPLEILRQYMAKGDSPTRGRELNIHFGDTDRGFIGQISPLGDMVPVMAGVTLTFKMRRQDRVGLLAERAEESPDDLRLPVQRDEPLLEGARQAHPVVELEQLIAAEIEGGTADIRRRRRSSRAGAAASVLSDVRRPTSDVGLLHQYDASSACRGSSVRCRETKKRFTFRSRRLSPIWSVCTSTNV